MAKKAKCRACKIECITTIDERGQMVMPKEIRERAGIKAGDKLAVVPLEDNGKICCIALIRTEELAGSVKGILGPIAKELSK